jgi:hypothetical protein
MASHNQVVAIRPRSLANVLLDLREARSDWKQALKDAETAPDYSKADLDAGDRMSEADTRHDDLRKEFAERFEEATGLTWKQVEAAIYDGVL